MSEGTDAQHRLIGGPGDGAAFEPAPEISRVGDEFEIRGETRGAIYRVAENRTARHVGWVDGTDVRYFDACEPGRSLLRAHSRVVDLDPRITVEAVSAILRNAGEYDRFILRIDPADRGLEHRWTGADGYEYSQALDVEIFEVTDIVWQRVRRICEAVKAS